jgi:hypothetical protein
MDEDFEASTMSDGLLDRKPRKRSVNLAVTLEDLFRGGTKKLKVTHTCRKGHANMGQPGKDGAQVPMEGVRIAEM